MQRALVFTDLDGCLLDHNSYSFDAALPALARLRRAGIPVMPATSKTRAELLPLREQLSSRDPFISENGAAVFIPRDYFPGTPQGCVASGEFWLREFSSPRADTLQVLASLDAAFSRHYTGFDTATVDDVVAMTGLSLDAAELALQREFSEPVHWHGDEELRIDFIDEVTRCGLTVNQGGRFLTLSGGGDKGMALAWLRQQYLEQWAVGTVCALAIGDGPNDVSMLEAADFALVIPGLGIRMPSLGRDGHTTLHSSQSGPPGWAEGVTRWLEMINCENA